MRVRVVDSLQAGVPRRAVVGAHLVESHGPPETPITAGWPTGTQRARRHRPAKVELGVDWRKNEPILLAVGAVLHADDAVANKVCALVRRRYAITSTWPPYAWAEKIRVLV